MSIEYGNVCVGETSWKVATIINGQDQPLRISDIEAIGDGFVAESRTCPAELAAHEQYPVAFPGNGNAASPSRTWEGATMLATLQRLGVVPSFSRPSVSDDNPYVESLFRTLKYCPEYPSSGFESVEHARLWVARFVAWYNDEHQHSGIGFVTPGARHTGDDVALLAARRETYAQARARHPERWSQHTREWKRPATVTLNPENHTEADRLAS